MNSKLPPRVGWFSSLQEAETFAALLKKQGYKVGSVEMDFDGQAPCVRYQPPGETYMAYCYGTRDFNWQQAGRDLL